MFPCVHTHSCKQSVLLTPALSKRLLELEGSFKQGMLTGGFKRGGACQKCKFGCWRLWTCSRSFASDCVFAAHSSGLRRPPNAVFLQNYCDNSGVEALSWTFLPTKDSLRVGLRSWAFWELRFAIELQVSHIPGKDNHVADQLSRGALPSEFGLSEHFRIRMPLGMLLHLRSERHFFPQTAPLAVPCSVLIRLEFLFLGCHRTPRGPAGVRDWVRQGRPLNGWDPRDSDF